MPISYYVSSILHFSFLQKRCFNQICLLVDTEARVVPIVLQSIAILLKLFNIYCNTSKFCNKYCNTFDILQYLLQYL